MKSGSGKWSAEISLRVYEACTDDDTVPAFKTPFVAPLTEIFDQSDFLKTIVYSQTLAVNPLAIMKRHVAGTKSEAIASTMKPKPKDQASSRNAPASSVDPCFVTENTVIVTIKNADCDLSLVDLPGLVACTESNNLEMPAKIARIVRSYMSAESSLIVTVLMCSVDLEIQPVIKMARDVDPKGRRTVALFTMPDNIQPGHEAKWKEYLQGRFFNFAKARYMVRMPATHEYAVLKTPEQCARMECNYFKTSPFWVGCEAHVGIPALSSGLAIMLRVLIAQRIPSLRHQLDTLTNTLKKKLAKFPEKPHGLPHLRLFGLAQALSAKACTLANGVGQEGSDLFRKLRKVSSELKLEMTRSCVQLANSSRAMVREPDQRKQEAVPSSLVKGGNTATSSVNSKKKLDLSSSAVASAFVNGIESAGKSNNFLNLRAKDEDKNRKNSHSFLPEESLAAPQERHRQMISNEDVTARINMSRGVLSPNMVAPGVIINLTLESMAGIQTCANAGLEKMKNKYHSVVANVCREVCFGYPGIIDYVLEIARELIEQQAGKCHETLKTAIDSRVSYPLMLLNDEDFAALKFPGYQHDAMLEPTGRNPSLIDSEDALAAYVVETAAAAHKTHVFVITELFQSVIAHTLFKEFADRINATVNSLFLQSNVLLALEEPQARKIERENLERQLKKITAGRKVMDEFRAVHLNKPKSNSFEPRITKSRQHDSSYFF